MPNLIQKEFRLEKTDKKYDVDDENPTLVAICQATPEQNISRGTFLSEMREDCIIFLKEGSKKRNNYLPVYEITLMGSDYIDDTHNRFEWIKRRIKDEITSYEFSLTVIACNILDYWSKKPLVEFINGQVGSV